MNEPKRAALPLLAAALATLGSARPATAQVELCQEAERFVREDVGMVALTEPDTIDDWRTQAMVPGCRVTAAGATRRTPAEEARSFYQKVVDAGWARTPDPRDAPHEASMRYRWEGADCLFNYYDTSMALGTEAEATVTDAVPLRPGERIFNLLVMCTPAADAKPRGRTP